MPVVSGRLPRYIPSRICALKAGLRAQSMVQRFPPDPCQFVAGELAIFSVRALIFGEQFARVAFHFFLLFMTNAEFTAVAVLHLFWNRPDDVPTSLRS